jgi:charged multivesicular body protein 4
MHLRRKRLYESQIEKLSGARTTLESQIIAIEAAATNIDALNAMRVGAQAMRAMHRNMFVELSFFLLYS